MTDIESLLERVQNDYGSNPLYLIRDPSTGEWQFRITGSAYPSDIRFGMGKTPVEAIQAALKEIE